MTSRRGVCAGLGRCHVCGLTYAAGGEAVAGAAVFCPRCGARTCLRKPNSLVRTWSWLIAAAVMYIPANLLPMMYTRSLFQSGSSTLLGGIVQLWTAGEWDLALIVFVASVAVPLTKIACLAFLLVGVQRRSCWHPRARTRLYRAVEFVGHWSMLDVFVVALLVALVQFGAVAQVRAEPGVIAFAAVVILTMIASMTFDPRLIWDAQDAAQSDREVV